MLHERRAVRRRRVALMPREAVLRPLGVHLNAHAVARHLSEHRRGGDGKALGVTLDHSVRPLLADALHLIRHLVAINKRVLGLGLERAARLPHALERRLQNVDLVDRLGADDRHRLGDRLVGHQRLKDGLTLPLAHLLRVVERSGWHVIARQHDGGGDHRPRQRPPPRLIDARHARDALVPQRDLERPSGALGGTHSARTLLFLRGLALRRRLLRDSRTNPDIGYRRAPCQLAVVKASSVATTIQGFDTRIQPEAIRRSRPQRATASKLRFGYAPRLHDFYTREPSRPGPGFLGLAHISGAHFRVLIHRADVFAVGINVKWIPPHEHPP